MASVEDRLRELEERLARLEGRPTGPPARPDRAHPAGELWVLDGLRERVGDDVVLFAGAVETGPGEHYRWQQGARLDDVLVGDDAATAESLAALGHPVRVALLRAVLGGVRSAAELQDLDGVGTSGQIYHHLRQLTAAGWLHTTSRGRYAVPGARVVPLLVVLTAALPLDRGEGPR